MTNKKKRYVPTREFSRVENSSAYRATHAHSRAFASSVSITRPQSMSTSWSASDWAFLADSKVTRSIARALRSGSRAAKAS